jgi:FkbM family methyltransferase
MENNFKKLVRTLQSELPFLKEAKDSFYLRARRLLRRPHEADFGVLSLIPASALGHWVDVGANHGQSIESILIFRPDAEIISFEPNPRLAQKLAARYNGRANVQINAKGLGDKAGEFTLFVPSYKGFLYDAVASLDRDAAVSWISERTVLNFNPAKLSIAEMRCEVETLDAQQLAPVFLKLDVQGYEYNVLCGGRETLRRHEPILLIERSQKRSAD